MQAFEVFCFTMWCNSCYPANSFLQKTFEAHADRLPSKLLCIISTYCTRATCWKLCAAACMDDVVADD